VHEEIRQARGKTPANVAADRQAQLTADRARAEAEWARATSDRAEAAREARARIVPEQEAGIVSGTAKLPAEVREVAAPSVGLAGAEVRRAPAVRAEPPATAGPAAVADLAAAVVAADAGDCA
jgi:hypothetical protein